MQELWIAMAMVLVLEGIMPFLNPQKWREMMLSIAQHSDASLRTMGLVSMLVGLTLIILIKH